MRIHELLNPSSMNPTPGATSPVGMTGPSGTLSAPQARGPSIFTQPNTPPTAPLNPNARPPNQQMAAMTPPAQIFDKQAGQMVAATNRRIDANTMPSMNTGSFFQNTVNKPQTPTGQ